jgi:hypothetical protein
LRVRVQTEDKRQVDRIEREKLMMMSVKPLKYFRPFNGNMLRKAAQNPIYNQ